MNISELVLVLIVVVCKHVSGYLRVCYYTNWSQYRPNGGKFTPENVDPSLCSHIIFAFGKLEGNKLIPYEWNDDSTEWSVGMYAKINNMKLKHPQLKTLLAVGGWNAGSLPFSDMVATKESRKVFINATIDFLRQRKFDGLDMDWEYPAMRGGRPADKRNLLALLSEMRQAFEQETYHTGRERLLLTAAVPAGKSNIDAGYDIPGVARSLDFINLMTYDMHGSWETQTGHNSPLFGRAGESPEDAMLNMDWVAKYWTTQGAPKHKLIIGLGVYGRSFKLQSPANNRTGAPAIEAGRTGKFTREAGFMSYYEICEELKAGATRVWHPEHKVPYMVNGDLWVGYDDQESIREKVRWIKQNGFGGAMVWSLALDDFSGNFCNQGRYPLLTTMNNELGKATVQQKSNVVKPMTPQVHTGAHTVPAVPITGIAVQQKSNVINPPPMQVHPATHIAPPVPTKIIAAQPKSNAAKPSATTVHTGSHAAIPVPIKIIVPPLPAEVHSPIPTNQPVPQSQHTLPVILPASDVGLAGSKPIIHAGPISHPPPQPIPIIIAPAAPKSNIASSQSKRLQPIQDVAGGTPIIINTDPHPPPIMPGDTIISNRNPRQAPQAPSNQMAKAPPKPQPDISTILGDILGAHTAAIGTHSILPPASSNISNNILPHDISSHLGTNNGPFIIQRPSRLPQPQLQEATVVQPAVGLLPGNPAVQGPPPIVIRAPEGAIGIVGNLPPAGLAPAIVASPQAPHVPAGVVPISNARAVIPVESSQAVQPLPIPISQMTESHAMQPVNLANVVDPFSSAGSIPILSNVPIGTSLAGHAVPEIAHAHNPSIHHASPVLLPLPPQPQIPKVNFSFSSNNSSNSSSSSSSSSSKTTNITINTRQLSPNNAIGSASTILTDGGRPISPTILTDVGRPISPTILTDSGRPISSTILTDGRPIASGASVVPTRLQPIGNTVISLLDGNEHQAIPEQIEISPESLSGAIPIDTMDTLAQILANLQPSLPTAGTVLLPEENNNLPPEHLLSELTLGNLFGSGSVVVAPAEQVLPQPRRRTATASRTRSRMSRPSRLSRGGNFRVIAPRTNRNRHRSSRPLQRRPSTRGFPITMPSPSRMRTQLQRQTSRIRRPTVMRTSPARRISRTRQQLRSARPLRLANRRRIQPNVRRRSMLPTRGRVRTTRTRPRTNRPMSLARSVLPRGRGRRRRITVIGNTGLSPEQTAALRQSLRNGESRTIPISNTF